MTDGELLDRLSRLDLEDAEMTEFEEDFVASMENKFARRDFSLSAKQRSCLEDLLERLGAREAPEVKLTPPPGKEHLFRERKPWQD